MQVRGRGALRRTRLPLRQLQCPPVGIGLLLLLLLVLRPLVCVGVARWVAAIGIPSGVSGSQGRRAGQVP